MFKYSFFIFFYIYNLIASNDKLNLLQNFKSFIPESYKFFLEVTNYIIGKDDSFIRELNISTQCYDHLNKSFFINNKSISPDSHPYYQKLFYYSSHNKNDLSSYSECINTRFRYETEDFTYLTLLIDDNKSLYDVLTTNNGTSAYLIGLCFIDSCTIDDYQSIVKKGMEYLNITGFNNNNESEINNTSNNTQPDVKIYILNDRNKSEGFLKFLELLPFIIIFIHIIFALFNSIPIYCYKLIIYILYCNCNFNQKPNQVRNSKLTPLKKIKKKKIKNASKLQKTSEEKKEEKKEANKSFTSMNDYVTKSIDLLYNISDNFTALTELKKQNVITNDGGLSYINGIKGISMIFFLFGSVYSALYSSLVTEQSGQEFYSHLNNITFSIYYIGIKFAPKLLLCTSGFSLFFKFICFLDGKVDEEKEILRQKEESNLGSKEAKDFNDNNSGSGISNSGSKISKKSSFNNSLLDNKYFFNFIEMQLHKYVLYILFMFFVLYSLDWVIFTFQATGPMWQFFNQSMINSAKKAKYLILLLIGYKSYFISGITPENENILHYFNLVYQEIIYFLFTTAVIFLGFKNNFRIDIFFEIVFIALIIFRILYYFLFKGLDDKDYFGYHEWGQFYTSILYNYSFYIIGIHYGMINYLIQKNYSKNDCVKKNKSYLISSLKLLKATKKEDKKYLYIISIISIIFIVLNSFIQQIIMFIIKIYAPDDLEKNMDIYKRNFSSQIIMLIDSDIFVIATNLIGLCMYLKGDNLINNILCHSIWSIFNRFYFSYILLINPIILYIFYSAETKIIFNMSNCILYSFICGIFVYSATMIIYVIFELPFKKSIRFWFKLNEKETIKERISNLEATYSDGDENNLLDSATASITDFSDDDENEDEY